MDIREPEHKFVLARRDAKSKAHLCRFATPWPTSDSDSSSSSTLVEDFADKHVDYSHLGQFHDPNQRNTILDPDQVGRLRKVFLSEQDFAKAYTKPMSLSLVLCDNLDQLFANPSTNNVSRDFMHAYQNIDARNSQDVCLNKLGDIRHDCCLVEAVDGSKFDIIQRRAEDIPADIPFAVLYDQAKDLDYKIEVAIKDAKLSMKRLFVAFARTWATSGEPPTREDPRGSSRNRRRPGRELDRADMLTLVTGVDLGAAKAALLKDDIDKVKEKTRKKAQAKRQKAKKKAKQEQQDSVEPRVASVNDEVH